LSSVVPAPVRGRGNVVGEVNGIELEVATIDVQITPAIREDTGAIIIADIATLDESVGQCNLLISF
jgi:hypothetical protein